MARENDKKQLVSYENGIKKSNDFSMAKLSQGLTLNQMQLFAFAIFSTQQDGHTGFIKADFERKFELKRYLTKDAKIDAQRLLNLKFSIEDLENDYFEYWNVFQSIKYDKGEFRFKWTDDMIPHILELKDHYVTTDLTITSQFKSSFSWTLYEYLKARYGAYYLPVSKEALLRLFGVENRKTYQSNTGRFKETVLDVAIEELNKYTELEVWYKEKKKGRAIVGFEIHWSTGKTVPLATDNQSEELKRLIDEVFALWDAVHQMQNEDNKEKAKKLVIETEEMRKGKGEQVTSKEASEYIPRAKDNLRWIEMMLENDKKPAVKKSVPFYNWLEERV
ncbi:replication initiation protein [Sporosarcina sp. ANT_H38]|uniref:replication initiation protein n=1 Tax=unclassified Sporosarcina TaxID=2647733 RepID=UPI0011F21730|nr:MULTISPECIES: replication initiation protein [unclassified Sporosarcina]KAA0940621.1 replication initiation protein [Sporosarcina sp. ANT_H38]QJS06557.1 initiator replication protein RepB [Sporosarcina sp.]